MIKYGIDSFILTAPWSLFVSVLMYSGVSVLGLFVLKYSNFLKIIKKISDPLFQFSTFGFLILLIILFPLILFNLVSVYFLKFVSLFLILLNLYYLRNYKVIFNKILIIRISSFNKDYLLAILLILGYFFFTKHK